jgi:hypothetical protein
LSNIVFTIISRNYAAHAATLMASVRQVEPDVHRVVVVTDGLPASGKLRDVEILDAASFVPAFATMALYYDALELNTAVKPDCFLELLSRPAVERVIYLDPDIYFYGALDAVWSALETSSLVMTPHLRRPSADFEEPSDLTILRSGVHNLGFLGVKRSDPVIAFIQWWRERCRFDCRVAFDEGVFTDQRWMDLAPSFVRDARLLRQPGLNAAYWNISGSALSNTDGRWTIDGALLIFFHFSGFDPLRPEIVSRHQTRLPPVKAGPLRDLLHDYARRLLAHGYASSIKTPYGHRVLADGRVLCPTLRRTFLDAARNGATFDDLSAATAWLDGLSPEGANLGLAETRAAFALKRTAAETANPRTAFTKRLTDRSNTASFAWNDSDQLAHGDRWRGPASAVWGWLRAADQEGPGRAVKALLLADGDLRAMFPAGVDDPDLLAFCFGRLAVDGRFDVGLAGPGHHHLLGDVASGLAGRAARLAFKGSADQLDSLKPWSARSGAIRAGFGLSIAARWPSTVVTPLQSSLITAPIADWIGLGVSPAMAVIWSSRPDLQAAFDLTRTKGRLRLARWMRTVGQYEYGAPAFGWRSDWIAPWTRSAQKKPPSKACETIIVSKEAPSADERRRLISRYKKAVWFAMESLRFQTQSGKVIGAPVHADQVIYLTDPDQLPAAAIALWSHGVRWPRASALRFDSKSISDQHIALGFVD